MQCLEVSGAVRPIYGSLSVKRLTLTTASEAHNEREDKGMEETEENRGSDGGSNFHVDDSMLQEGKVPGPDLRSETGTY